MHYIKWTVNSSLLTSFWLLQTVCGTLDHCFIMTHIIHSEGDLQIYFCVIFLETRHHTQAHVTSGTLIDCPLSLAARRTDGSRVGLMISPGQCLLWRLSNCKTFFVPELDLPTNPRVGRSWLFPACSFRFLTRRSLKSWWLCLATHEGNSIQLLCTVRSRMWKNNFMVYLKVHRLIE